MKIVFVFPGYGSQFVGMAKELYDEYRIVQEYFEEAANCLDENFVKLCFASSDAELARMDNAYVSLFLVGVSIAKLLQEQGIQPAAVAGYNQGEYTAFCAGGGITFPDGLYLLSKYASIYGEALKTMDAQLIRVVGLDSDSVRCICNDLQKGSNGDGPFVAVYHDARTHIVAGSDEVIARFRAGVESRPDVSLSSVEPEVGMHSPLMDGVFEIFNPYMEKIDCKDMTIPFTCTPGKLCVIGCDDVKLCISGHLNSPVYWAQARHVLSDYDCIVEIGPGTTLSDSLRRIYSNKAIFSINTKADLEALLAHVSSSNCEEKDNG